MKTTNMEKRDEETGIISEYKKTIFCRKYKLIVGQVRVHANDNEWRLASKLDVTRAGFKLFAHEIG